jgi:hypothetical protein
MPLTTYTAGEVLTAASLNANFSFAALAKLGQVVQTVKTDTFTSTSTTYVDITGLSLSITPTSASSKILVFANVNGSGASAVSSAVHQQRLTKCKENYKQA